MKNLCLLALFVSFSLSVIAQSNVTGFRISGQIVGKASGKGVPYATIIIRNDSINLKKMQACDESGRFSIDLKTADKFILSVSSVGYKSFNVPVIISSPKTDVGKLAMEEGVEMQEVTVNGQKPLVKTEADKIVYSIETDLESRTSNVLEMLRKVPLIMVDAEENITLNGQSNFKVLINGKSSTILSANLKDVLKSMPANSIKDIEVITNPSSKYEAEGIGGIINIITLKRQVKGYNGTISTGIDSYGKLNGNVYYAKKINKFAYSSRFFFREIKQPESSGEGKSEYFYNSDYHFSENDIKTSLKASGASLSGEVSYEADTFNLISGSFWGYLSHYSTDMISENRFMNTGNRITRSYNSAIENQIKAGMISGNIDYQRTFKKPDKTLTFSYKIDNNPGTTRNYSDNTGIINYTSYRQKTKNETTGREQTFQTDYYDPLTKSNHIEGGLKLILRHNISNSEVYYNDSKKINSTNDLDYDQQILGAYAGYLLKLQKASLKTGLRMEQTWNNGTSIIEGKDIKFQNHLFNLIPYFTFSLTPAKNKTIKASYTQRLLRPGIGYLNPYVNNSDSMNVSFGNPSLKAEKAHSFEAVFTYFTPKFSLSASSTYSFINNSIERISKIQSNGASYTTYKNIGEDRKAGINLYFLYRPAKKITLVFNGGANYVKLEANDDYSLTNDGFNYRLSLQGSWNFRKDGTIIANGGLSTSEITLQRNPSEYYYSSLGISQYLLKRKLQLYASVTDPFITSKKYTADIEDFSFATHYELIQHTQIARLSITYNFGKIKSTVKKATRGIKNDDVKSGENNQEGIIQ